MNKRTIFHLIILSCLSILVSLYCQLPELKSYLTIFKDINQFIMPSIASRYNPHLFESILMKYTLEVYPKAYLCFLVSLSHLIDPIWMIKLLPALLTFICAIFWYKIGSKIKNSTLGFFLSFISILHFWTLQIFIGATPRSFGVLFFSAFLYYILCGYYIISGTFLTALFIFYPSFGLIALLLYITAILLNKKKLSLTQNRKLFKKTIIILAICLGLIYLLYFMPSKEFVKNSVNIIKMYQMPEFHAGGKEPFFFDNIQTTLASGYSGINLIPQLIFLLYLSLVVVAILRSRIFIIPKIIWRMLFFSILLFFISFPLLLTLYYPNRYIIFTLPFFLIIIISLGLSAILEHIKPNRYKYLFSMFICAAFIVFYIPLRYEVFQDNTIYAQLFSFLETLPKDTLIAGHPYICEPIPTFAHKKVLISHRLNLPWHPEYYKLIKQRNLDFFKAYYSDSPQTILAFCEKYTINYLVIDKSHFDKNYINAKKFYLDPFNDYIIGLIENKTHFAVFELKKDRCVFEDKRIFVLKMI